MLTGRSSIQEKEEGLDCGADDYLTKPFNMKELSARIRALLRRPAPVSSNVLKVGGLTCDPGKYRVTRDGAEITLLPREFALLEFLMRHPDEVFSGEALLSRVWSTDSEATADTVRTNIMRLRQKIDKKGNDSIIETIPRVGYRMKSG
jgi:two-component system OmpR family response regulator